MSYRLLSYVSSQLWAIRPDFGASIASVLARHAGGRRLADAEVRAAIDGAVAARHADPADLIGRAPVRMYDANADEWYTRQAAGGGWAAVGGAPMRKGGGKVAVIGVYGVISPRATMVDDMSGPGGTSIEALARRFDAAMADPDVKAVMFDHDSPGGNVIMVQEMAAKLRAARGVKPVEHISNGGMHSASYWLGSQADRGGLSISPSSELGSIGVYSIHEDVSEALAAEGVKVTMLVDGANKTLGNPFEPLSQGARDAIMVRVTQTGEQFRADVAKGRGVPLDTVRKGFGDGLFFGARDAVARGMADQVATFEEVVRRLVRGPVAQVSVPAGVAAHAAIDRAAAAGADVTDLERRLAATEQALSSFIGASAEAVKSAALVAEVSSIMAGPVTAPGLAAGSDAQSCASCEYFTTPSGGKLGACSRHDFTASADWVCEDWEASGDTADDAGEPADGPAEDVTVAAAMAAADATRKAARARLAAL